MDKDKLSEFIANHKKKPVTTQRTVFDEFNRLDRNEKDRAVYRTKKQSTLSK